MFFNPDKVLYVREAGDKELEVVLQGTSKDHPVRLCFNSRQECSEQFWKIVQTLNKDKP